MEMTRFSQSAVSSRFSHSVLSDLETSYKGKFKVEAASAIENQ